MNAIPYDGPEQEWDSYEEGTEEFARPGRPRRQWFNRKSAALFAVVLGAIGFYAGVRVEKSQVSNSSATTGAAGGGAAALRAAAARGGTTTGATGSGAASRTGAGAGARSLFGAGGGGFAGAGGANATFGTVSAISGNSLYITETSGNTVKVTLSSATKVTKNVTVGKKAVRPGDTVVVAGAKNSNGTVSATTLSDTGAGLAAGGGSGSGSSGSGSSGTTGSSAVSSLFGSGRAGADEPLHLRKEAVLKRKLFGIGSRRTAAAVAVVAAGCLIAACGSASSSSNTTSSTTAAASAAGSSSSAAGGAAGSARRAQLVACLKSHGVTLPARPAGSGPPSGGGGGASGGGTGTGTTGTGTTPRRGFFFGGGARNLSPKMQAAFKACGAGFGFGGGRGLAGGRISHTAITKYVTCVRQHGYNLPSPNFSGKGPVFPANIRSNAKFQAASKACQSLLIPPRPSGGTSTTSGA